MKYFFRLFFLIALLTVGSVYSYGTAEGLELVKTIGDDRDDYLIFGLSDAVVTPGEEIFAVSAKGNFVTQFDWDGKFVRRIGRKGQGPGDLYLPGAIDSFEDGIYILDQGNHRLVRFNLKSEKYEYIKQVPASKFSFGLVVLDKKHFMGVFQLAEKNRGRIGIVDDNWNVQRTFFHQYPVPLVFDTPSMHGADKISIKQIYMQALLSNYSSPVLGVDSKREHFLVSFRTPDNPIDFFVFDRGGNIVKKFTFAIVEKKYRFWKYLYDASLEVARNAHKWPARSELKLDSAAIVGDTYVAFVSLEDLVRKKELVKRQRFCLIFNKDGQLEKRIPFKNNNLRIFKYSNGYFLGTLDDAETEQLLIYRLQ